MKSLLVLSILGLAGCATSRVIMGPDGSPHRLISCGQIEMCYDKATQICGKYKIVNTSTEDTAMNGNINTSYKLLVKCDP